MRKGTMMVAIFAAAAYAATIEGGNRNDALYESPRHDWMYGYDGRDVLRAWQFDGDRDNLYGGNNNDWLYADDGDGKDLVDGGKGRNDYCEGDDGDRFRACDGNVTRN